MGRLYADEQFPYEVVEHLRSFGHVLLSKRREMLI